ncbi:MAG: alpha/beta fold hydrolase [Woeseiaceae bacterium]|nr:alpha/beta fold hydrolase [Woeseiaceae bacterium]
MNEGSSATPDRKRRSRLRSVVRVTVKVVLTIVVILAILRGIVALGERVPMIEATGPEVVDGDLTTRPIRFAQTDFYVYPPRVDAEEGRLQVPARRDDAASGPIGIRYVRFPTTGSDATAPPIVYLAGGPGGSGTSTASGDRFKFFMALREAGDVIALDQRGVWGTHPYPRCPNVWTYPLDIPTHPDDLVRVHEPQVRECWSRWETELHPDTYTTAESVEDLEALREALGVERLNLVGISYGTHLGLAYIRTHPDRVGRAVLAGVEGPNHTYKSPARVDEIVRAVDETLAREAGWDGFVEDIETATARLAEEQPMVTVTDRRSGEEVEVALGPYDLKLAVYYGLGEREDFLKAARRVRQIAEGDYSLLAQLALRIRSGGAPIVMPISMDCASGATAERLERIQGEMADALVGDVANLDLTSSCPFWPVEDLGDDYRSDFTSDVPVLAISGTLDLRTPPANADEALAAFTDWRHVLILGGAHSDDLLIATPEIADTMVQFLQSGEVASEAIELPPL